MSATVSLRPIYRKGSRVSLTPTMIASPGIKVIKRPVDQSPLHKITNDQLLPDSGDDGELVVIAMTKVDIENATHQARILTNNSTDPNKLETYVEFLHKDSGKGFEIYDLVTLQFYFAIDGVKRRWNTNDLVATHSTNLNDPKPIKLTKNGDLNNKPQQCAIISPADARKLYLYFVVRKSGFKLRLREIVMTFERVNFKTLKHTSINEWTALLKSYVDSNIINYERPKNLLAYVNPFGGKGKAKQVFASKVQPVLQLAGIKYEVIETQAANHAKNDVCNRPDLEHFQGILTVGGDGMYNEVMTGVVSRAQKQAGLPFNSCHLSSKLSRPQMRIGMIPAGSMNSLCFSIHGTDDPLTSILHVLMGHSRRVDACGVYEHGSLTRLASTMVAFGFLGDAIRISEKMRRIGPVRYRFAGFRAAMGNPHYTGKLQLQVLYDDDQMDTDEHMNMAYRKLSDLSISGCTRECPTCSKDTTVVDCECANIVYNTTITGKFSHIVGAVTSCKSKMSPGGLSPKTHLGDGCMDLGIVGRMNLFRNLLFINKTTWKGATHVRFPEIKMFRVKSFSYTSTHGSVQYMPKSDTSHDIGYGMNLNHEHIDSHSAAQVSSPEILKNAKDDKWAGNWNIDGEIMLLPKETIHFRVHQQLMNVFCEGIPKKTNPGRSTLSRLSCTSNHISPAVDEYY